MYIELHCHSAFSFLDGASLPEELVTAALELGHSGLALTDHNGVSGSMEFAQSAHGLGLKAMHGAEIDLDDGRHLTLLVKDARGWANLCRLITRAHEHTREWVQEREAAAGTSQWRAERPGAGGGSQATSCLPLAAVLEHAEGLFCLSGCAGRGVHDEQSLRRLRDAFGTRRLKVELQRPYLPGDQARNRRLAQLADRLHLKTIATGNVHAHRRARAPLQDAFVALQNHATLDSSEPNRRGNFTHVMASPDAMAARFADYPEAVIETARVAEQLEFDLRSDLGYRYPGAEDHAKLRELSGLCEHRLQERYADQPAAARAEAQGRLDQELKLIEQLNLAGFFVLHHELLELAREVAAEVRGGSLITSTPRAVLPPGRGRGSSVSSIVCYLTGLSHIDPVANELSIGRFLSEDLRALPDIDLDFPRDIRAVLIPRVNERFGQDRAALVAAFPTYRARGAIRELGKVLGLPQGEIERVARGSEGWDARKVTQDIETALTDGGSGSRSGRWEWLARLAEQAHGLPRHLSQHSGGMIIATRPLIDCCPMVPAAMEGRYIVQWDKDSCADAHFLKIDLLGLGMLSAVERCVELIARTRDEVVDLSRIPHDDGPTYEAIQSAETTGVFQIESRAQMQSLLRTRPQNLKDIAIQVAIVRPGPIQGGAVNPYIERLQRSRADPNFKVPYEHPSLEPALKETLGTIIFQDQVLEVAAAFAGFRPGQAEELRRAMSRKRSDAAIEAHHRGFVEGAMRLHNVSEELAELVFAKVKGFAGFGFPKSHAAAFGLLAYQSTWLRVHYGPEFLCSLMNEQPMGFYPPDALAHEAQRRGITVHPPDINSSEVLCDVAADGSVRIGLGYVRGVRNEQIAALVAERQRGGPFQSLTDLASRAGAGAHMLELLAWAGVCDSLARADLAAATNGGEVRPAARVPATQPAGVSPRRVALWQLGAATDGQRQRGGVQLALPLELPQAPQLRELTDWERMLADYATTGVTTGEHPLALLRGRLPGGSVDSCALERLRHGTQVKVAGLVVARQRPGTAGGVVFVLLEDEHGTINLIVPPRVYDRHKLAVRTEPLLLVEGKLERHPAAGGGINVLVQKVAAVSSPGVELAQITELTRVDESADDVTNVDRIDDFRAVAPPVMSFAAGRRR